MRLMAAAMVLAAAGLGVPAAASTTAAWKGESLAAARACRSMTDLRDARIGSSIIRFSDAIGVDAMLVTGTWRPAHMQGKAAQMLCIYHRSTHRAEVVEAAGWNAPVR